MSDQSTPGKPKRGQAAMALRGIDEDELDETALDRVTGGTDTTGGTTDTTATVTTTDIMKTKHDTVKNSISNIH